MDISGIVNNSNITRVREVELMISDYNENMRYYNRNMRELIEIYRERINEDMLRNRQNQRQTRFYNYSSSPLYNSIYDVYNSLQYPLHRNIYTANTHLEDVIVRPTNQQIRLAIENTTYDVSLSQFRCPISLESFEQGDEICRIKHCGHLFKRSSLMSWFQRNVRCPVCRYDIREYRENEEHIEEENEDENEEERNNEEENNHRPTNNTRGIRTTNSQSQSQNLTNILRHFLTGEIQRNMPYLNNAINELTFTFDIPYDWDGSSNILPTYIRR